MAPDITFDSNRINLESDTLGSIELRHIRLGDLVFIEQNIDKIKDEKEFVCRLMHNQMYSPKLDYSDFVKISDNELRIIAREFIKENSRFFDHFKETSDADFYANFRNSIKKHLDEEKKKLEESLAPLGRTFDNFLKHYEPLIGRSLIQDSFVSELSRSAAAISKQWTESVARIAESMRPAIEQIAASASAIENLVKPQIESWQRWADQNKRLFENIRSQWDSFQTKYSISEAEAIRILKKHKWFVSPSLPIAFVFEVVRIGKKKGNRRSEINGLFVSYFCSDNYRELETLINSWKSNPLFKPRMKIFRDCIHGLKRAKAGCNPSNYVLPTLIAQIDGIQQEYMEKRGLTLASKGKWKDASGKEIDWKTWYKAQTANQDMMDVANDIFLNILFQKSQRGKPLETPFTFNRHKILHGENVSYGRIDNTLRAFLLLDFLASLK
jgi:hypothetical protein